MLKLGHLVYQRIELREVARLFLRRLSESVQATASMAIFDVNDMDVVFVAQSDSPDEVQIRWRIGAHASRHATAVGKVLTTHLDRAVVRRLLKNEGLPKKTKHTVTSVAAIEKVGTGGYATDRE